MVITMTAPCPYCHTRSLLYFQSRDYNRGVTRDLFNHYRCSKCHLIFIAPLPKNPSEYYPDSYHFIPDSAGYLEANSAHEQYKIDLVQQFSRHGRLLEIGPGHGSFTYLAKAAGFEVEAIEMDERCCNFLREVVGIRAIKSDTICDALQDLDSYDVIAMWHVIEHLLDPWTTLSMISTKLKPGGILVIAAPNPDSFQFLIQGRWWPHVDAPRHVMLIPATVLAEHLDLLGLKLELITTRDKGSLGWNTFGWSFFFSNMCSSRYLKRLAHLVGRIVAICLYPIESREGRGTAYTMIYRKVL